MIQVYAQLCIMHLVALYMSTNMMRLLLGVPDNKMCA